MCVLADVLRRSKESQILSSGGVWSCDRWYLSKRYSRGQSVYYKWSMLIIVRLFEKQKYFEIVQQGIWQALHIKFEALI